MVGAPTVKNPKAAPPDRCFKRVKTCSIARTPSTLVPVRQTNNAMGPSDEAR